MNKTSEDEIKGIIETQIKECMNKYIDLLDLNERNQHTLKNNQIVLAKLLEVAQNSVSLAGNNLKTFTDQLRLFSDQELYESRVMKLEYDLESTRKGMKDLITVIEGKYVTFQAVEEAYKERILRMDIRKTTLPTKIINCLINNKIKTLSDLLNYSREEISKLSGISNKSIKIIEEYLAHKDIRWIGRI